MDFKNHFFANIDEVAKLCKVSDDAYNHEGWLILKDIWNERVAKGVNCNPHDFTTDPLPF